MRRALPPQASIRGIATKILNAGRRVAATHECRRRAGRGSGGKARGAGRGRAGGAGRACRR